MQPYRVPILALATAAILGLLTATQTIAPAHAQQPAPAEVPVAPERPFQLPFARPSSPDTWLMAQPYGNTTGAYRQRFTTYGASGGIHFGVDLSAPCGTDVVAIADGVVFKVDGPFGSPPHNLMIDHPELGFASMYGHLLEAPDLKPGQVVKQGEVIAKTGDSAELCYRRPHLHLEIRDLKHVRKYNPAALIDANWDNLALVGDTGRDFARDLEEPRKWQSLYDQPEASTGGPIMNDFTYPWPFDWGKSTNTALTPANLLISKELSPEASGPEIPLQTSDIGRQITTGDCCTQLAWSRDSAQIRFIDQPAADKALGIWAVTVGQPKTGPQLVTDRLGLFSPDGTLVAYPDRRQGVAVVERLADGQTWEIDTQERSLSFSPDSRQVFWSVYDEDAPRDNRTETYWLANVDGSDARAVYTGRRTSPVAWLGTDKMLMTRRMAGSSDEQLFIMSLADSRQTELLQLPDISGLAFSPNRQQMVYYLRFRPNPAENGLYLLNLDNARPKPEKLPFFGAYRWRDDDRLIYVPFEPDATEHNFFEYNVTTGQSRELFPAGTGLVIANNDWRISPDGQKIALLAATGATLNGIWVLDLN